MHLQVCVCMQVCVHVGTWVCVCVEPLFHFVFDIGLYLINFNVKCVCVCVFVADGCIFLIMLVDVCHIVNCLCLYIYYYHTYLLSNLVNKQSESETLLCTQRTAFLQQVEVIKIKTNN